MEIYGNGGFKCVLFLNTRPLATFIKNNQVVLLQKNGAGGEEKLEEDCTKNPLSYLDLFLVNV